jgi:ATP-binding cassette subfamily B protein
VHLSRNSSEVISGISIKSSQVVTNILMPTFTIISSILILTLILVLLVIMNPVMAIFTIGLFGLFYAFIIFFVKKRLMINSEIMSHKQNEVIKSLQEGLGGIRDVLLDGVQNVYCKIFHHSDLVLRKAQADNQVIGGSPRFAIESISIVLIAFLAFFLVNEKGGIEFAVPILGALALSAQRALPLLQQIFQSWSSIRGSQDILQDILSFLNQKIPSHADLDLKERLAFKNSISLTMAGYKYNSGAPWVFKNLNLNIKKGSCVGFIGATGSGKSTLLDIIMSLLPLKQGFLAIDGEVITLKNQHLWQSHISHVPQHVFLSDATIAENIAFGIPLKDINYNRLREAAIGAQILEVINTLNDGFNTITGERGVKFSGGERQRIGIARALYKKSNVIILDEATSALDSETESAVMEIINNMQVKITILIIAHRLSTLKKCDQIYELDKGVIIKSGTYKDIINNN